MYWVLTVAVLGVHLGFILWVIFGTLVTKGRRGLSWLHIGSLLYAIVIEAAVLPCPFTRLEHWARNKAGMESYDGDFLPHLLESVIYLDVRLTLLVPAAVAVCLVNLGIYAWRWRTSGL
jgi:uncharacterized protein DUF2784